MSRTLQPEDVLSHYRIIGPLGAGGMGEVYLALDETLERNVALKILPPRMFKDDDRVRRFILEAKSASSLNHPHIVTIYEIGQAPVQSKSGTAQPGDGQDAVHFISMELVAGETLTSRIHQEKTDLRVLLGFLAQAAEGLAKAHAAGIVHRDLKPGNIMVTKDGYAKVLDFGLAKLIEQRSPEGQTSAPTEMVKDLTGQGMVLGTIGYMSPEQVRGSVVDHRSDIFSFGCVLYEAATRRRPFVAETSVETMNKILNEKPAPIEEIAPQVPTELRRLIRRCLAKSADQRLQSMKDLAIELREIVDEYDTLSAGSGSGGTTTSAATAAPPAKSRVFVIGMIAAAVVGVAGIAFGIYGLMHGRTDTATAGSSFQSMKVTSLLSEPDVESAILSADGRYLAYTLVRSGLQSLHVRQVATGGDVEILKLQQATIAGLAFSPDGDYLFYQSDDPEHPGYRVLLQVPSLGGTPPRKRGFDVDTAVTFSPDGKRVAFRRGFPQNKEDHVVVLDLDMGTEKTVARLKTPAAFQGHPSWSPDGRHIAVGTRSFEKGLKVGILMIDPESGRQEPFGGEQLHLPFGLEVSWLSDGSALVFLESENGMPPQIWLISYPAGQARRITNDQTAYDNVSVAKNGSLAAIRHSNTANIWAISIGQGDARPITRGAGGESAIGEFDVAPDGAFVFLGSNGQSTGLFRMGADASNRQPISSGSGLAFQARLIQGGVLFNQLDGHVPHIWRAGANGDNPKRVTDGPGELLRDVSPDGTRILLTGAPDLSSLSTMPSGGGERVRIADDSRGDGDFSPDGKLIHYAAFRQAGEFARVEHVIVPAVGGPPVATLVLPGASRDDTVRWTPDGKALAFVHDAGGFDNVYRQPIAGGEPTAITHVKSGRVRGFSWSRDGSRLQMTRSLGPVANVWVTPAGGGEPVQVSGFKTGTIFSVVWGHDGKTIFLTYGDVIQDVVLIRDFR